MAQLPHDDIIPFRESDKTKKEQVAEMFDRIAGKYDFMNRLLSARIDIGWRKKGLNTLKASNPKQIIDIATGTADLAIMACRTLDPERITGVDISAGMLEEGRKKIEKEGLARKIDLVKGDSEDLPFAADSFDAAMAAFGVRNFENLEKGLAEICRVLRPGGKLMILEFSQPHTFGFAGLYRFYMDVVAPQFARIFARNKAAYQYLNKSARAFPEREEFLELLKKAGFSSTQYRSLTMGICCIYTGEKK